jgi:hypothetical protein
MKGVEDHVARIRDRYDAPGWNLDRVGDWMRLALLLLLARHAPDARQPDRILIPLPA